jgi:hypothetical protein
VVAGVALALALLAAGCGDGERDDVGGPAGVTFPPDPTERATTAPPATAAPTTAAPTTAAPTTAAPTTAAPDPDGAPPTTSRPDPDAASDDPVALLGTLPVEAEAGEDAYEREAFGEGWLVTAAGCEIRDVVLIAESKVPATRDEGCDVSAGRWTSLYDGTTTDDPSVLDIDHLVPLAEAWASGASGWDAARRERFANDVNPRRPDALVAVTLASNRSKGDRDPAEWMPARRDVWCRYAAAWIRQKAAWHLTVDRAEHDALAGVLDGC